MKKFILLSILLCNTAFAMNPDEYQQILARNRKIDLSLATLASFGVTFISAGISYLICKPECETNQCMTRGMMVSSAAGFLTAVQLGRLIKKKYG